MFDCAGFGKKSVAAILLLVAAGDNVAQALAAPVAEDAGRIGIVSLLEPEVTNVHLGLTVFGNYNNRLSNDWHLDGFAYASAKALLEKANWTVADVKLDDRQLEAIRSDDDQTDLNYSGLTRDWVAKYRQIIAANHIAALVILRDRHQNAGQNGVLPYRGYGVMSPMGRKPDLSFVFTTSYADVIAGDPPRRAIKPCSVKDSDPFDPRFDTSQVHVDNLADIKIGDISFLKPRFEKLIERSVHSSLASSGVLGEQTYCSITQKR